MVTLYHKVWALVQKHFQIVKYIISGGTAAAVDIFFIYIFTDIFGIWYLISAIFAFLIAFCVSFTLQKFWTFSDKSIDMLHKQVATYLVISTGSLLWNTFLMYTFVDIFGMWYIFAQILAGGIVALSNFFMYKKFVFKNTI